MDRTSITHWSLLDRTSITNTGLCWTEPVLHTQAEKEIRKCNLMKRRWRRRGPGWKASVQLDLLKEEKLKQKQNWTLEQDREHCPGGRRGPRSRRTRGRGHMLRGRS